MSTNAVKREPALCFKCNPSHFGPNMHPFDGRVVSNFIRQALAGEDITLFGDGGQTRSFCFVSDLVDGLMRLMQADGLTGPQVRGLGAIVGYSKTVLIAFRSARDIRATSLTRRFPFFDAVSLPIGQSSSSSGRRR